MSNVIKFPRPRDGAKWFEVKNATDESADVYLYDVIGDPWIGTDAMAVVKQLNDLKAKKINLRINSPGGYVSDGMAIYNAIARHPAEVTTYIDGLAASIASVIALAGKRVLIAENALMMIHNPWSLAIGDAKEFRKQADILDQFKETIVNVYETRTGMSRADIAKAMDDETWYTAKEAVGAKLADESVEGVKAAACFDLNAFGYQRAPAIKTEPEKPEAAKASTISSTTPHSLRVRRLALLEKL